MSILRPYIQAKPRLFGVLFLIGGLIGMANLWSVYRSGGTFFSKDVTSTPMLLLLGLGTLVEPRLLLAWSSDREHPVPVRFKVFSVLLCVLAALIGFYLEHNVFKDWKSAPLGSQ